MILRHKLTIYLPKYMLVFDGDGKSSSIPIAIGTRKGKGEATLECLEYSILKMPTLSGAAHHAPGPTTLRYSMRFREGFLFIIYAL